MTLEPRTRQHQRIRLKRLAMASVCYAMGLTIVAVTAALGVVAWDVAADYTLFSVAIIGAFYAAFRSNLNLRFKEPNLTFAQVLSPLLPGLYLLYQIESPQARAAILFLVMVPLLFGMFDLSLVGLLIVALCYFAGYSGVFLISLWQQPALAHDAGEWIVLFALALLLIQIGVIGGFISQLRQALRRKNLELGEAFQRISDLAMVDELTGVFNRRRLLEVLQSEVGRAVRGKAIFSVCMLDIDQFKGINDRCGHAVGDRVLMRVARTIESATRDIDTFGRYGGEEFVLILPMTDVDAACSFANRLRARIEALELSDDDGILFTVTVSIGVAASTHEPALEADTILRHADKALYRAKAAGRNCVQQLTGRHAGADG